MINARNAFLLLVGDDGAMLLPPLSGDIKSLLFASSTLPDEQDAILNQLEQWPQTPVILLADTRAQHIRHEDLPKLNARDRRKLIHRRLQQAFPHTELKSFLCKGNATAILVAIEKCPALQFWTHRIAALPNRCSVYASLPVESASMIAPLMLGAGDGWVLLLSCNKTGGVRQIVIKDGALIFSRITTAAAEGSSAGFVASELALEIKATRQYLTRFGLTNATKLRFIAIVPPALQEALKVTPMDVAERNVLTPHQAALALQLPFAPAEDETMGDCVHALWAAQKITLDVPLMEEKAKSEHRARLVRLSGRVLAAALIIASLLHAALGLREPLGLRTEIRDMDAEISRLESQLAATRSAQAQGAQPLDQLRKAAERERLYVAPPSDLLTLVPAIEPYLAQLGTASRLDWANGSLAIAVQMDANRLAQPRIDTVIDQMRAVLPAHKITMTAPDLASPAHETLTNATQPLADKPALLQLIIQKEAP